MEQRNSITSKLKISKRRETYRLIFQLIGLSIFVYFGRESTIYVILLTLPLAVLIGPAYCGWMCPRGMFQNIAGIVGRKFLGKRYNRLVSRKVHDKLRFFRYVLLLFVLATVILYEFEVLGVSVEAAIADGLVAIMVLSILLSFFVDRAACRYFCKDGAFASLVNLVKIRKIRRDKSLCNSCGICDKVCPMWIEVSTKGAVEDHSCISCFKCICACPQDALSIEE
ncbi:polyferredoxin [Methanohalophilus levihalophilus]|uniref:4Fe-4S binding protein n=1 Tax=Methanohalophilus levihalophilus TaxID=1431282 RepID=UPI001AE21577|nr:4Fe-4S binding protein [Methanohalophilus levihalophilus]MBP2029199.1 polyferredoxin [Methanohalophilus levihalophilus]